MLTRASSPVECQGNLLLVSVLKGPSPRQTCKEDCTPAAVTSCHTQVSCCWQRGWLTPKIEATGLHSFQLKQLVWILSFSLLSNVLSIPDQWAVVSPHFRGLLSLSHQAVPLSLFPFSIFTSFFELLFFWDFIYLFSEREEGRERGRDRNINWLPLTRPQLGTWPATQACALTGIYPVTFWFSGQGLNPLSHTGQGHFIIF